MPIFYRGAGVGTWWHTHDPRLKGFIPHSPAIAASTDQLMLHIARGTTTSPYVSLTRSYGVAVKYAMLGRTGTKPTAAAPAFVWEIEIVNPIPANLVLIDPIKEVAETLRSPLDGLPYQHDGSPDAIVGLIDMNEGSRILQPVPMPPFSNPPPRAINISLELQTLVFALRDAEILAAGTIPASFVRSQHNVF